MVQDHGFYLDGKWVDPKGRKRFETSNPATGETLATFPLGTKDDVAAAAKAAKAAFDKWKKTPPPRRGELLLEAARIFRKRKEDLGRLVSSQMRNDIAERRGDAQEANDFFAYAAGQIRRTVEDVVASELAIKSCVSYSIH